MKNNSNTVRNKAIVIGGSIAGLLAARVLSDFYGTVTILEKDGLPENGGRRRGVPHAQHAHGVLASGMLVLDELFPDFRKDLREAGGFACDALNDARWFFQGACLKRTPTGADGALISRPVFENIIRRRVRHIPNVEIIDYCSVNNLLSRNGRVTGVHVSGGIIEADLVVDASGRGSRSNRWLEFMDFEAPKEEKIEMRLNYTTRLFKRRGDELGGDPIVVSPSTPEGKRGGVMIAQEGGYWIATLYGHFRQEAPGELEGFIQYAKSLEAPYIYDVLRNAEPAGEPEYIRFPASRRRRYEKLRRFPEGFLAFGDAICSFNPVYGQGMSVAALEAIALREQLSSGTANLAFRFFKKAAKIIDNPWNMAAGNDLRMPETIGPRALSVKVINWYISKLHKCAQESPVVSRAFMRVAQLLESPGSLLTPSMILRVLFADLRRRIVPTGVKAPNNVVSSQIGVRPSA